MELREDAIAILAERLAAHPGLQFAIDETDGYRCLRIEAPNEGGFPVILSDDLDEWTVIYGNGGHSHFDDATDAINHVGFTLSAVSRLVETWKGDALRSSKLQELIDGEWVTISATIPLMPFRFWTRRREIVLQNHYFPADMGGRTAGNG